MSETVKDIAEDSVRGSFFLFTGKTLSSAILVVCSIVIAGLLGPESYGLYSLALVVPSILLNLMGLGIGKALTRFSAKLGTEGKVGLAASIIRSGFIFTLALSVFTSLICFILSETFATHILNRPEMGTLVKIASLVIPFQAIITASNSTFIGLDRTENNALVMNIHAIVKTILSSLLVVAGLGVAGALMGHISGYIIAGLAGSLMLYKLYRGLRKPSGNSSGNLTALLGYGFPLYLSTIIELFLGHYRTLIPAFFVSNAEIGNLKVATTLSSAVSILTFPLGVLFPAFSKVSPDSGDMKKLFRLSVKYTAMLIVPVSVLITVVSGDFVHSFYGQKYDLASSFLSLYILTFLYSGLGSMVLGHLLNGIGETKIMFKANLIGAACLIPLAPALTMLKGIPGLIIAILVSQFASLVYRLFITTKRLKLSIDTKASLRIYLTSFLSAIPLLIFLRISPLNGLINLVASGLIYLYTLLTIAPILKTITREDLVNLRTILDSIRILRPLRPILKYEAMILELTTKQ